MPVLGKLLHASSYHSEVRGIIQGFEKNGSDHREET